MRHLLSKFRNLRYRYKITWLVLAAGVLPVAIIAVYFLSGMIDTVHGQEQENMYRIVEQSSDTIGSQALVYENLVDYLSYSPELRDIVVSEPDSDYETYLRYTREIDPLLQMPQIYHQEIRGITMYAENIKVPHGDMLMPLKEAESESWYSRLDDTSHMQWTVRLGAENELIVSRRFYEGEESTAVLSMRLDYDTILQPFVSRMTENMGGLITDRTGQTVYSFQMLEGKYKPEDPESLKYLQDHYRCFTGEIEETGWTVCVYQPRTFFMESVMKLIFRSIPILVLCIIALTVIGYFFAGSIVKPLERLTENMNQIQLGFRKVTVDSKSDDEVGVLVRAFRRMMDEMNRLISEVYEAKILLQNTEMRALQAQINPHFLYNSLSIINWKAIEAGNDDISKVTLALSTYYRTSLNRGETMTSVENEISNIRAYLRIQLIMHDDSFRAEEEIDQDIMECRIPKLILQPLVENAIDHGLDVAETEEKILWIRAVREEDRLLFEVRDNGAGMEQEKADEILTYHSSGYGLRNVAERIQVLYGADGQVEITSRVGGGTCVRIRIPKRAEEDK